MQNNQITNTNITNLIKNEAFVSYGKVLTCKDGIIATAGLHNVMAGGNVVVGKMIEKQDSKSLHDGVSTRTGLWKIVIKLLKLGIGAFTLVSVLPRVASFLVPNFPIYLVNVLGFMQQNVQFIGTVSTIMLMMTFAVFIWSYASVNKSTIDSITANPYFYVIVALIIITTALFTAGHIGYMHNRGLPSSALISLSNFRAIYGVSGFIVLGYIVNKVNNWSYFGLPSLKVMPALYLGYSEYILWFSLPLFGGLAGLYMLYSIPAVLECVCNATDSSLANTGTTKQLYCPSEPCICGNKFQPTKSYSSSSSTNWALAGIQASQSLDRSSEQIGKIADECWASKKHSFPPEMSEWCVKSTPLPKVHPGKFNGFTTDNPINAAVYTVVGMGVEKINEQQPLLVPAIGVGFAAGVGAMAVVAKGDNFVLLNPMIVKKVAVPIAASCALIGLTSVLAGALEKPTPISGHLIAQEETARLSKSGNDRIEVIAKYNESMDSIDTYVHVKAKK